VRAAVAALLLASTAQLAPLDESVYREILEKRRGKVVLVNFWATWCEPCREEMPHLAALARKYGARGLSLVTISADEPEQERDAAAFLKSSKVSFPAWLKRVKNDDAFITFIDKDWSGALPATFLFDRKGAKAARFVGEADLAELEVAIRKLL
jgi:thiol-disulfide isomerase/thioredoxin